MTQQNTFLKLFKEYASYRSDLKVLGTHLSNLDNLPNIPTRAKFKLLQLGDVTLYSGRGPEQAVEIEETVGDYTKACVELKSTSSDPTVNQSIPQSLKCLTLEGDVLTFPKEAIPMLLAILPHGGVKETLLKKAKHNGGYLGLKWSMTDDGMLRGVISSDAVIDTLNKILK